MKESKLYESHLLTDLFISSEKDDNLNKSDVNFVLTEKTIDAIV